MTVDVDLEDLPAKLVQAECDEDELLDFVVSLDLHVASYDFTERLRDKLTEALEAEDGAE